MNMNLNKWIGNDVVVTTEIDNEKSKSLPTPIPTNELQESCSREGLAQNKALFMPKGETKEPTLNIIESDLSINAELRRKVGGEQLFSSDGSIYVKVGIWLTITDKGIRITSRDEEPYFQSVQELIKAVEGCYSASEFRYLIRFNPHESTKTLTKADVDYIFSLNRWGCILKRGDKLVTNEELYDEFNICPCGCGTVPRWNNGGSLFPSNFTACINLARKKFISKGYREGVVFKDDRYFSFFSATTGLECFDINAIIKGKVFPSVMASPLFPYSVNFSMKEQNEFKSSHHCFGVDEATKDWLLKNGWEWVDDDE